MSKKKSEAVDLSIKDLIKRYGNAISTGQRVLEQKKTLRTLTVSPAFDLVLKGGILEGSWTLVSGDEKCGKSTLCLQICVNAQKEGRRAIYLDGENRLKDYNLIGVKDLDLDKMTVIHAPEDGAAMSAEDFLNVLEHLMKLPENEGAVVVIDSSSSLIPRAELDSEASGQIRASLPKLLTHWIKKNVQTVIKQKLIMLVITHYVTNTSGYGKTKIADSGKYLQYQSDTRLDCKKVEDWEEGTTKVGQAVEWIVSWSSKGASGSCVSYLRYGTGIDFIKEIIVLGEDLGLIDKAGSWYTLSYLEDEEGYTESEYKFQGGAKVYEFLQNNPDKFDILNNKVKEMLS